MLHRDIASLNLSVQAIFREFLKKLDEYGIKYYVSETLREQAVQRAYYAQGRQALITVNSLRDTAGLPAISERENKNIITNCDGVTNKSKHQSGKAMDIYPADDKGNPYWNASPEEFDDIGQVGEELGLTWGRHFKGLADNPHFEVS